MTLPPVGVYTFPQGVAAGTAASCEARVEVPDLNRIPFQYRISPLTSGSPAPRRREGVSMAARKSARKKKTAADPLEAAHIDEPVRPAPPPEPAPPPPDPFTTQPLAEVVAMAWGQGRPDGQECAYVATRARETKAKPAELKLLRASVPDVGTMTTTGQRCARVRETLTGLIEEG